MSEAERNLSILEHIIRYCDQIDEAIQRFGDDGQVFRSDAVYAHNYGSVDAETAWEIVQDDIPTLRAYCEKETQGTLT